VFVGQWLGGQNLRINRITIKKSISVGFGQNDIYLQCKLWPINFNAQIPTASVKSIQKRKGLWHSYYVFRLDNESKLLFYARKDLEKYMMSKPELANLASLQNPEETG
jgi:hypothetical protein